MDRDPDFFKSQLLAIIALQGYCIRSECSEEELWTIVHKFNELIPFRGAIIGLDSMTAPMFELSNFVNFGFDEEWVQFYSKRHLDKIDPVMIYSRQHSGAFE